MIQVKNLTKSFSGQPLFSEANFSLGKGEKVGLVGRNGTGKSTLFKMILGKESPDSGEVIIPKNYPIGVLEQHLNFTEDTILKECLLSLPEEEKFDEYKAEKILSGLGFSKDDFHQPPQKFSGGYQVRVCLAKVLLQNPALLLLDEPTNYLDIISIRWLKDFLKRYQGEMIIITHDRDFMDDIVTHIIGLKRGKTRKVQGNTHKYYSQIREEELVHEQTRQNIEKKKREIQSFVDRFRASATKATQAQSKLKQIEKMDSLEELAQEASMNLRFPFARCSSKNLLSLQNISFSYDGKKSLFQDINLSIQSNDRLAIIGKNGKGKSTFLNLIGGLIPPTQGKILPHDSLKIGHFGQTHINTLNLTHSIEEEVHSVDTQMTRTQVRKIAGSMMFTEAMAEKKIKVLSGGERARVLLAKILATPTNLLLLDEPTNHLDMESIEILIQALKDYKGAIIIVTHDERILNSLAKKLIVFRKNNAEVFYGDYPYFLEKIGWEEEAPLVKKKQTTYKDKKAQRGLIIQERSKLLNPLRKKMEALEKLIIETEDEKSHEEQSLILASEKGDVEAIEKSSQRISELSPIIEHSFSKLEELSLKQLEIEEDFQGKLEKIS